MLGHSLHFYVLEMKDWLSLSPILGVCFGWKFASKLQYFRQLPRHVTHNSSQLSFTPLSGDRMWAVGSNFAGQNNNGQ